MEARKTVEIVIKDLAFDGKSVGQLDSGKVCFTNGGLPGETIEAVIIKNKRRFASAKFLRVIKKSDQRVEAPCIHFDICGGCVWQDLAYEDQLAYKQKQVVACIERIGKLPDITVHPITPAEPVFRYRNKMEYSFNNNDPQFNLGMHHRGEFNRVFDLTECHIAQDIDSDIVDWFREYVKKNKLPAYDVKDHHGYMRFVMIRHGIQTGQLMVNIITNYGDLPESDTLVDQLVKAFPQVTTICHNQNGQKSNISVGEVEKILYGPGYIEDLIGDKKFIINANSFFQTNTLQAQRLFSIGFEMLQPAAHNKVLDLYCGAGSIGILLSDRVQSVIGVELVADAVRSARENAALNKINNISFYEGMVKDFLREHSRDVADIDTVIVDPPRAGLSPKALKRMLRIQPEKILYISCNPATFARDAAEIVENGYNLPEVTPVDMFPHTMHIELAAVFYKDNNIALT